MNFEIAPKPSEIQATWDDARLYCFSLSIDGKIGWRLPTKEELTEIYLYENDFEKDWYWSSTEYDTGFLYAQHFGGGLSPNRKNECNFVRAIRDLKDN